MFSYHEKGIRNTYETTPITLALLKALIKANPHQEAIEKLRSLPYGGDEYKKLKAQHPFPVIKPHGTFKKINGKENIQQLSGFLYFDIDACNISSPLNLYKQFILRNYSEFISMMGTSIGGQGIFFLIKVKGVTEKNFQKTYGYFRSELLKDLPTDKNAGGIARNWFIPYDNDVYCNENIVFDVKHINNEKCNIQGCRIINETKEKHNDLECYTFTPIPIESFWDSILLKSNYSVIDDVADVVERPFYQLKLRKIKDGYKHRIFPVMIWTLMKLNPHLSLNQITSFMLWFNKNYTNHTPMLNNKLIVMVQNCYKSYDENKVPFKMKSLWLNPKMKIARKAKQKLCNGINAEIRKSKSMEIIKQAIRKMIAGGAKINQAQVSKRSGVSRQCVSRHWDECMNAFPALQGKGMVVEPDTSLKAIKGSAGQIIHLKEEPLTRTEFVSKFNDPFKSQGQLYKDYQTYLRNHIRQAI